MEVDSETGLDVTVDGVVEQSGVQRCGDDGDFDALLSYESA